MHQLCFDIHHLVLTTAKCQLIVPPSRKHNAENIFRSQSFKRIENFVCAHVGGGGGVFVPFLSRQANELLTLQKRSFSLFAKERTAHSSARSRKSPNTRHQRGSQTSVITITELGNSTSLTTRVNQGAKSQVVRT